MYDVVALGEILIDFVQLEENKEKNPVFEANPGGAPCNVLSMLNKMGKKTAFIGKVGQDSFGEILEKAIGDIGIDKSGLVFDEKVSTTLAFVHKTEDGDRDFSFYRKPGADIMLSEDELNWELIKNCKIFHFGSLSFTDEPVRTATKKAIDFAKENQKIVSFDPNLRENLWDNLDDAKEFIWYGISLCDILKIADNEIKWLTGIDNYDDAVEMIKKKTNAKMINVTLGKEGSISYYNNKKIYKNAFLNENTLDTTGAGDTFCGCVLSFVLDYGLEDDMDDEQINEMLEFANAAASIVTTRKGALCSMPEKIEIEKVLKIGKL